MITDKGASDCQNVTFILLSFLSEDNIQSLFTHTRWFEKYIFLLSYELLNADTLIYYFYLSEIDCENGMRPAADIIHSSRSRSSVYISCIHKFFHITIILH